MSSNDFHSKMICPSPQPPGELLIATFLLNEKSSIGLHFPLYIISQLTCSCTCFLSFTKECKRTFTTFLLPLSIFCVLVILLEQTSLSGALIPCCSYPKYHSAFLLCLGSVLATVCWSVLEHTSLLF